MTDDDVNPMAITETTKAIAFEYVKKSYEQARDLEGDVSRLGSEYKLRRVQVELGKYLDAATLIMSTLTDNNIKAALTAEMVKVDDWCALIHEKMTPRDRDLNHSMLERTMHGAPNKSRKAPENLTDFDGSHAKWPAFRDLFNALVVDAEYSELESFLLLQKHCKGSSMEILAGYAPVATSFQLAWNSLKEVFEDSYSITQSLIDKLMDLPAAQNRSVLELRRIIDTCRSTLRQLKTMEYKVDEWDAIIINMMARKVPAGIIHEWEQHRDRAKIPTLNEFLAFLDGKARLRIFATEYVGNKKPAHVQAAQAAQVAQTQSAPQKPNVSVADPGIKSSLPGPSGNNRKPLFTTKGGSRLCYKCKGEHLIYTCAEFLAITNIKAREQDAIKLELCVNCLRKGHDVSTCTAEGCRECNGAKHNRLLCFKPKSLKREAAKVNHANSSKKSKAPSE